MKPEVKNQHYVPQFYLKKFSVGKKNKEKIWVFNKKTFNLKNKKIKYVASKDFFYDFEKEFFKKDNFNLKEKQWLEQNYGKIESKTGKILKEIEKKIKNNSNKNRNIGFFEFDNEFEITSKEKFIVSEFLAVQYIRTNSHREEISTLVKLLLEKTTEKLTPNKELKTLLKEKKIGLKLSKLSKKGLHLYTILDNLKNEQFKKIFFNRIWVFQYNKTNLNYCTSDTPIGKIQFNDLGPYGGGLAITDILTFPITNKINLCMYLPSLFDKTFQKTIEKCYFQNEFDKSHIEEFNLVQTSGCNAEIYSIDNNIERIEKECKKNNYSIQLSPKEKIEVF